MTTVPFSKLRRRSEAGSAVWIFLTVLAISVALIVAFLFVSKKTPVQKAVERTELKVPATPAPEQKVADLQLPEPSHSPAPEIPQGAPVEPAPETPRSEPSLDIEAIAQNPALWPKTVALTKPLLIPAIVNGKAVGQAQLPANTMVRMVKIAGSQLEVEHLNQRLAVPIAATDLITRATAIRRASPDAIGSLEPQRANPVVQSPVASTASTLSPKQQSKPGDVKESGRYRKLAAEVMEEIQEKFWIRQAERYAKKAGSTEPDMVWGAGVMFSAVVGAARHDPGRYEPVMRKFFDGLNGYWDAKAKVPGYEPAPTAGNGNDKYYDDNAWMVISFLEAYELTQSPRFRRRAEETLDFVLSGWDETVLNGGIWWHELREKKSKGKNTCANAPAAVGCLLSAKYSQPQGAKQRLEMAEKIVRWTVSNLQLSDGLFADSIGLNGDHNRAKLTYNSALMLRAFLGLHRATKKPEYLSEAQRIGRAADSFLSKETGAYRDPVKWAHLMVEADLELYRTTHEDYLFKRAAKNADFYYQTWKNNPPDDLISAGSIARTLWLMADAESEVGRKFWEAVDLGKKR